jgi:hypothetical protein
MTCFFVLYTAINYSLIAIREQIIKYEGKARRLNDSEGSLVSDIDQGKKK